jgi:hypothetical protein
MAISDGKLKQWNLLRLMKSSFFFCFVLPLITTLGCVNSHQDAAYATPRTVVAPTSPSPAVRVYPYTTPRVTTAPGESDDLTIANSVRSILSKDSAHVYGNVDIAINRGLVTLRGTVPTEHDRLELQNEIGGLAGVGSVDNQLGVDLR